MTRRHLHTALSLFTSLAVAGVLGGMFASLASAASIGVNFEGGGNGNPAQPPTSVVGTAGFVPQSNWNNYAGSNGTLGSLVNSNGSVTGASVTISGAGGTYAVSGNSVPVPVGGDQLLNEGFVYNNGGSPSTVAISGIPYANYSVYVYELNDAAGRVDATTLGSTTYYGSAPNPTDADHVSGVANTYLYTQSTSTSISTPTPNGDYVLFAGLTGSSQSFTVDAVGNGYVSGVQIVQYTPEPSSLVLVGLGAVGLLIAARRRRRG